MRKETWVAVTDLQYVAIECPQCHTQVVMDMKEKSAMAQKYGFFAPKDCPGCRTPYDSAIRETVDELQKLYSDLLKIEARLSFRGEAKEETRGDEVK